MKIAAVAMITLLSGSAFAVAGGPVWEGLKISAEVSPSEVEEGKPFTIAAVIENVGGTPVKLFVPESTYAATLHDWSVVRSDGAWFRPYQAPVQTMWTMGMQGEVATLAPGEKRRFEHRATDFVAEPFDARAPRPWAQATPLPLEPGTYRAICGLSRPNDQVPFGLADFKTEDRSVKGLWTGMVAAQPVAFRVLPSKAPRLRISAPQSVVEGDPFPLEIRLENRSDQRQRFAGRIVIEVSSKPHGTMSADVALDMLDRVDVPAWADLGPGESRVKTVDLARLSFQTPPGFRGGYAGLYRIVGAGTVWISATSVGQPGDIALTSNGMWGRIEARPFVPEETLHLEIRPGADGTFVVALKNAGAKPIVAPKTLAYPLHLTFALTDPEGKRSASVSTTIGEPISPGGLSSIDALGSWAVIVDGLSWDGDAFDAEAPPPDATVTLPPGGEVTRSFDMPRLVHGNLADSEHGGLPGRRYRLQAFWRNLEAMGVKREDGLRVAVGGAQSAPVDLTVPPR